MKVVDFLRRENNNLDVFRLLAAGMVIWGHAYSLAPEGHKTDFVQSHLHFDYSGSLAVKIFFFLSGLMVSNSLLEKKDISAFVLARIFRVWPALIVVVLVSVCIIGPLVTSLPLHQYFRDPGTWQYVLDNLRLKMNWNLPGVFKTNAYPGAVNGSLWTLPWEVGAYIYLLLIFMVGAARNKYVLLIVAAFFLHEIITVNMRVLDFFWVNDGITMALCSFIAGVLVAAFKQQLSLSIPVVAGAWVVCAISAKTDGLPWFFCIALYTTLLWLASTPLLLRLRLKADISYGVYIWAFPVQQALSHFYLARGVLFNQLWSIVLCCMLGTFSWYVIEKPGIRLGGRLAAAVKRCEAFLKRQAIRYGQVLWTGICARQP